MVQVKNIKELAAIIGISATTVSRVLNGKATKYRISDNTSKKVLDAAARFNYYPNIFARGLRLEKTETLGLIVPDIANPFFASIAKSIEFESRLKGYSIILCDSMDSCQTETILLQLLAGRKVEGIILAPVGLRTDHISDFLEKGVPVVIIDRYLPGIQVPSIITDNYTGALQAVEHMISKGHRKIGCIQGLNGISLNTDRVNGYKDALMNHNIRIEENLIAGNDFGEQNGYDQTMKLLSLRDRPTAILALSNLISLGIMRALSENGLAIPDDISLVAFDDQPYSAYLASPMTTVDQPKEEIGKRAVNTLLDSIHDGDTKRQTNIMLKPRLIVRNSVKDIRDIKMGS